MDIAVYDLLIEHNPKKVSKSEKETVIDIISFLIYRPVFIGMCK